MKKQHTYIGYPLVDAYGGNQPGRQATSIPVPDMGIKLTPSELIKTVRRIEALEERVLKLEEADEVCASHQLKQMKGTSDEIVGGESP